MLYRGCSEYWTLGGGGLKAAKNYNSAEVRSYMVEVFWRCSTRVKFLNNGKMATSKKKWKDEQTRVKKKHAVQRRGVGFSQVVRLRGKEKRLKKGSRNFSFAYIILVKVEFFYEIGQAVTQAERIHGLRILSSSEKRVKSYTGCSSVKWWSSIMEAWNNWTLEKCSPPSSLFLCTIVQKVNLQRRMYNLPFLKSNR